MIAFTLQIEPLLFGGTTREKPMHILTITWNVFVYPGGAIYSHFMQIIPQVMTSGWAK